MKISVCIVTYNHKKFISQAIESVLSQKTNFPFEILIGEDASTDGTHEICEKYAKNNPDKIRLFLRNRENVIYINGNPTGRYNFIETLNQCKGKYIALLDGDDYWTDPLKLQKQVDFLDTNEDFSACFHNTEERTEDQDTPSFLYCDLSQKLISTKNDLALRNFMPTCSVVFRNNLDKGLPTWYNKQPIGDWVLHILNAQYGKIKYIPKVMGVHRLHPDGIWSHQDTTKSYLMLLKTYDVLINYYSNDTDFLAHLQTGKHQMQLLLNSITNKPSKLKNIKKKVIQKVISILNKL